MTNALFSTAQVAQLSVAFFNAGIGGNISAFRQTGLFRIIHVSEEDRFAAKVLKANGMVPDVGLDGPYPGTADVFCASLLGGDFSPMGRQRGLAGRTGRAAKGFMERVAQRRPAAFCFETVPGVLRVSKGKAFSELLEVARKAGYRIQHEVLAAADFGSPILTKRLVVVGVRAIYQGGAFGFPKGVGPARGLVACLDDAVPGKYHLSARYERSLTERTAKLAADGCGFGMRILGALDRASSLCSGGSGRERNLVRGAAPAAGKSDLRRLTPSECLRLSGFPEGFSMPVSDSQAYRLIGGTALPRMMGAVADALGRFMMANGIRRADADLFQYRLDRSLVHAVVSGAENEIEQFIARGANPNSENAYHYESQRRPILSMARTAKTVELLVAAGAGVNLADSGGRAPLHVVKDPRVVSALIAAGADPDMTDRAGRSPLHRASDPEIVRMLVAAGGDVGKRDKSGRTALHEACNADVANALVKAGADVGARTKNGDTPLHVAVERGLSGVTRVLVRAGADVLAENDQGVTPMSRVEEYRDIWDGGRKHEMLTKAFRASEAKLVALEAEWMGKPRKAGGSCRRL